MESINEFEYTGKGCVVPKGVTSVRFHPSVVEVEDGAFRNCNKLREVEFNGGLQKIGVYAFWNCTSLSSITIPSTVTEIDNSSLDRCISLRVVAFHGVPREIGAWSFGNCTSLERFTFPTISARLDNLVQTGHWEEINNRVGIVRGVVERSRGELFVSAQTMDSGGNWIRVKDDLDISYNELKEATSIFELALWKFKLDQVDKANPIPRKKCRMDVPGPVKDIILTYLSNECHMPVSDV